MDNVPVYSTGRALSPKTNSQPSNQTTSEYDGVLLFDEIQSIPIEESNLFVNVNHSLDLSNSNINDETRSHDSFYDDNQSLDNKTRNSIMSNTSASKLNEYVLREKEVLKQINKTKMQFNKKQLYELSNSIDYLSFNINSYFLKSIVMMKHSKKKKENEY